jgi:hypothetical protein
MKGSGDRSSRAIGNAVEMAAGKLKTRAIVSRKNRLVSWGRKRYLWDFVGRSGELW